MLLVLYARMIFHNAIGIALAQVRARVSAFITPKYGHSDYIEISLYIYASVAFIYSLKVRFIRLYTYIYI